MACIVRWLFCAVCLLLSKSVAEEVGTLTGALLADDACLSKHRHQGFPAAVQAVQIATHLRPAQHPQEKNTRDYLSLHRTIHGTGQRATRRQLGMQLALNESTVTDSQFATYAELYRQDLSSKQMIFWSHISKSSGTTFCHCGWQNGCRAYGKDKMGSNCHPMQYLNDWPHWGGGSTWMKAGREQKYDTCKGLYEYVREHNYTLEGNENFLISEGLCPNFWNAIIFREPIDRLLSHMALLYRQKAHDSYWAEVPTGPEAWNPSNITPEWVVGSTPILSNNYVIRSLLGKDVYLLPPGRINETHLEKAKQVLEQFDVVYVTTPSDDDAVLVEDIGLSLGWTCEAEPQKHGGNRSADFISQLRASWTEDDWKKLKASNYYDMELYKHAGLLYKIDNLVFRHPQFKRSLGSAEPGKCGYLDK